MVTTGERKKRAPTKSLYGKLVRKFHIILNDRKSAGGTATSRYQADQPQRRLLPL